ncbi:MAG: asparagine synthase (glutamine-hydrolyzing) [Nitrospira sp.]|nr:asparagine synthase (glutamine-hydrolyzing) [Nitrospira sp.]
MCGIAGIVQVNAQPVDAAVLEALTSSLAHRGPDGEGYVLLARGGAGKPIAATGPLSDSLRSVPREYSVGFGHRRLAILDRSPLGHQPMSCDRGDLWLTYNGEIYNYLEIRQILQQRGWSFRSMGDAEVLLYAYKEWGEDCLRQLNGMFAFALWDAREQTLFCARDRFGIKPFYYRWDGDRFCFASEIKALLQDPSHRVLPNDRLVYDYLTLSRQDHSTETFFQGIHQLAPGERLTLRLGWGGGKDGSARIDHARWWRFSEGKHAVSLADAAVRTRELLEDSIRLELRADVPIGSCLSGGLDSSTIVCLMSRLLGEKTAIRTFSSCHQDERFDERRYIRPVLERTGAANKQVFSDAKQLFAELPRVLWHQDEPFAGTSILAQWAVMNAARGAGMKVLLDGQGADELLFGYPGFMGSHLADLVTAGHWWSGIRAGRDWRRVHGGFQPTLLASLGRGLLPDAMAASLRTFIRGDDRWLAPAFTRSWRSKKEDGLVVKGRTLLDRHMERAVTQDLPALLHYEDRNAMAFSLEARVPFLDHRLVEWLAGLPPEIKLNGGMTKVVLREAMAGLLPEEVRLRRDKMGFVTPEDQWLRVDLRAEIESVFRSDRFHSRPYWRASVVQDFYRRYCDGQVSIGSTVWRWVSLELWLRRFCD